MKTVFCLFGMDSRRVLDLGERTADGLGFQGPTVYLQSRPYHLPEELLTVLLRRFREENLTRGAVVVEKERLFSGTFNASPDEIFSIVGRDADDDPPFEDYLPELQDPEITQRLIPVRLAR